jgi:hypothetical protein
MSAKLKLARSVLTMQKKGLTVPTHDALQLRNWANHLREQSTHDRARTTDRRPQLLSVVPHHVRHLPLDHCDVSGDGGILI